MDEEVQNNQRRGSVVQDASGRQVQCIFKTHQNAAEVRKGKEVTCIHTVPLPSKPLITPPLFPLPSPLPTQALSESECDTECLSLACCSSMLSASTAMAGQARMHACVYARARA